MGRNQQDHFGVRVIAEVDRPITISDDFRRPWRLAGHALRYAIDWSGPLAMGGAYAGAFFSSDGGDRPDMQIHFLPLSSERRGWTFRRFSGVTANVCQLRPASRGRIGLGSADLAAPPRIDPGYLSDEGDRRAIVAGLRFTRELCREDPHGAGRPGRGARRPGAELAAAVPGRIPPARAGAPGVVRVAQPRVRLRSLFEVPVPVEGLEDGGFLLRALGQQGTLRDTDVDAAVPERGVIERYRDPRSGELAGLVRLALECERPVEVALDRRREDAVDHLRAFDRFGAGDAFAAGYICGLLDGRSRLGAVALGNAVAGWSVRLPGNIELLPDRNDLRQLESGQSFVDR